MVVKKVILSIIAGVLFIGGNCTAQEQSEIDTLIANKVDSLVLYTKSIWYNDTNEAKRLTEEVLKISKEHNYLQGLARGYNLYGVIYDIQGDYHKSLTNYKLSFEFFHQLGDSLGLANCQYNMALVLQNDEQFAEALRYVEKAYEYYISTNLHSKISMSSMTLGNLYLNNGRSFDSAIRKMKEAERISREYNDTTMLYYALHVRGDAYVERSDFMDSAIFCFEKAIDLMMLKNKENHWGLGFDYLGIAKASLKSRNLEKAIAYNTKALREYKTINQKLGLLNTYTNRKDILEKQGKYKDAIEAFNYLKLYSDSIYSQQRSQQINRMKTEYETEKKEAEIVSLSQEAEIQKIEIEKQRYAVAGLGIALLLVFGGATFIHRQRRLQQKHELTQLELEETQKRLGIEQQYRTSELKALRSQMSPHFVFNALNSIQEYIMLNEKKLAGKYLGKFADLMRTYLNHSQVKSVSIREEVEALELYLELEKLRFEDELTCQISIDTSVDLDNIMIPTLFSQPLIML